MYRPVNHGYIEVVVGPMYSGKSEELIRRLKRAKIAKQNIIVFKPHIDDRYSKSDVTFEKAEELIKIVESVIQEIYSSVFDSHASIETINFNRKRFKIIEILAEEKNKRIAALLDGFKNK